MKFFENLASVLKELESRGSDKILMDLSVPTKKAVLDSLLSQAKRISGLTGE